MYNKYMRMKKIFYNSTLAKVLLFFSSCHTITIGPFVCSKLKEREVKQCVRNHESTHARQWIELTIVMGLIIWLLMLFLDISACWLLFSLLTFYVWYLVEWVARWYFLKDIKRAYKAISFEQEANKAEYNETYLENCNYFIGWIECLRIGWTV